MAALAIIPHTRNDVVLAHAALASAIAGLVHRAQPIAITVVDTLPGMGSTTATKAIGDAMGLQVHDLRTACIDESDLRIVRAVGHEPDPIVPRIAGWAASSAAQAQLIVLDEAGHARRNVVRRLVSLINAHADANGICAVTVMAHGNGEDLAMTIRDTLGTIVGRTVETISLR